MLHAPRYPMYTHGEIKPRGWLQRQLRIQADGLPGQLNRMWPDVRDSRWFGGDRDGWERVPYWLDGFIPLAYLLEDDEMIARARRCMDAILARQQEDGFLCPCPPEERNRYDMWAMILIAKVMTVYADLSGDERIAPALSRALKCLHRHIRKTTLFNWGAARWFECLIPICWLYERTGEGWLLDLAHRLRAQGIDFGKVFDPFLDTERSGEWTYLAHVVNLAMALRQDVLYSRISGSDPDASAQQMLDALMTHHSMAAGHFTGDECLAGDSPIQGSELCGVVEAMYSYEQLLSIGGDPAWGDWLERLAFNALPAACSADMWSHQYDQQTNQIRCVPMPRELAPFTTNNGEAHIFGLEPHYGCCTANMGQGWPKLVMSAFMADGDGAAVMLPVPAELTTTLGGTPARITVETDYPFRDTAIIRVAVEQPAQFTLSLRIPGTAQSAAVNGKPAIPGTMHTIRRTWEGVTEITLTLTQHAHYVPRPRGMQCLWRGPLLYALPIGEKWTRREYECKGVPRIYPYCDYAIEPTTPWAYGFAGTPASLGQASLPDLPFDTSHPPVWLDVPAAPITWREEHGICAAQPDSRRPAGEARILRFIPYGCTQLRMTELPPVK